MALKSIIRKRHAAETELDGGPSNSRIRLNHEPLIADDISELDASKYAKLGDRQKITFNDNQTTPTTEKQYFNLPKPIMNYIFKTANGKVMKKFYRICKYIYQRNPYCIVDEMNDKGIKMEGKWYPRAAGIPEINNIWVLKKLKFQKNDNILKNIVRCEAKWIQLPKGKMNNIFFDILTKSKKNIRFWDTNDSYIFLNGKNNDENHISIEKLFINLPKAKHISAIVNGNLNSNMIRRRRNNKITSLKLTIIVDNTFDPNEYYKLFEKVIYRKTYIKLIFKCSNQEAAELCHKKCRKLHDDLKAKWKPVEHKPNLSTKIYILKSN